MIESPICIECCCCDAAICLLFFEEKETGDTRLQQAHAAHDARLRSGVYAAPLAVIVAFRDLILRLLQRLLLLLLLLLLLPPFFPGQQQLGDSLYGAHSRMTQRVDAAAAAAATSKEAATRGARGAADDWTAA